MDYRLSEKLKQAGGVVARLHSKIEARADAVIAREQVVDTKIDEAFTPHETMLDDQMQSLDQLEKDLATLTNGAPASPLPNSTATTSSATVAESPINAPTAAKLAPASPLPANHGRVLGAS